MTEETLLDVNDVTALFPYDATTQHLTPDLPLDSFISKATFEQMITAAKTTSKVFAGAAFAPPGATDTEVYENWRIVGFRFDPCAPSASFASGVPFEFASVLPGCLVELRLIAQPVTARRFQGQRTSDSPLGVKAPQDFAAHLVFDLDLIPGSQDTATLQAQFRSSPSGAALQLVRGLQAIKAASLAAGVDTNGALLGVHPGLKADLATQTSQVSDAVTAYLTAFLKPERLTRATFFGISFDNPTTWDFFAGNTTPSFTQTPLIALPPGTLVQSQFGFFSDTHGGPQTPEGVRELRRQKIVPAFEIENPETRHVLNSACASCHSQQTNLGPPAGSLAKSDTNVSPPQVRLEGVGDLPATRYLPPTGVTGYIASDSFDVSGWNVHNLGYFGTHPRVAGRTVNETAAVVDLVNRLLAGDAHKNPGLDCGSDRATLDTLYICQLSARTETAREACFVGCTKSAPTSK